MEDDGTDSAVMTLRKALQHFEAKGYVEYTLGGHVCSRPPSVQQGREDDCFDIQPDTSNSLAWRPNAVPTKNLKAANLASAFPWPMLESSPLEVVPCITFLSNFLVYDRCLSSLSIFHHFFSWKTFVLSGVEAAFLGE